MEEKQKITLSVSWFIPWTAGWLFTLGFAGLPLDFPKSGWENLVAAILYYLIWPALLGKHLAK